MSDNLFPFDHPIALAVGLALAIATIAVAALRHIALPRGPKIIGTVGLLALALAAGGPTWRRPAASEVAVLVDLSASTRGAAYRDRAALNARLQTLLGDTPRRIYLFAGDTPTPDTGGELADLPADHTIFAPPPAAAILLFSDGQFALPAAAPRTFVVIDPGLQAARDGRVASLRIAGGEALARVGADAPRSLTWTGATASAPDAVPPGDHFLPRSVASGATSITARLSPDDRWPENDTLSIEPPPPAILERWFVTTSGRAPAGFRAMAPDALPADGSAYLGASVIVLDNIPADRLSPTARERLAQYVRELSGGLLITGGESAFAAGSYVGTALDALSPLASSPPQPATHWIFITDGSGSMGADADGRPGGATRWQVATSALLRLLPSLPPDDPVDLGSFAEQLRWWTARKSARQMRALPLPPADINPGGPSNVRPALEQAAVRHDPSLPGNLLLLSDADVEVGNVPSLVALLKDRKIRLHLLAIEAGSGLKDLQEVVRQTGGRTIRQDDAARWPAAAAELLQSATEKHLIVQPAEVTFGGPLRALGVRRIAPWNRTWIKPKATELAATTQQNQSLPMAAVWQAGEGRVAAAAFSATAAEVEAMSALVARPPRDPRINVVWESGPTLKVMVDAVDARPDAADPYLNSRPFVLELTTAGSSPARHPLQQTAPGHYELELPAPLRPTLATLRDGDRAAERVAVAGRYPPEFDAIGLNRQNLNRLAERTGGRVIEASENKSIDFRWPKREIRLMAWLAAIGAAMLAGSMLWWRWR